MPPNGDRDASNPFKVLVIGGSYAGLSVAGNLLDLCHGKVARFDADDTAQPAESPKKIPVEIIIADERDGFLHLIGIPLALASEAYAPKAWQKFADISALQVPGVRIVHGRVVQVDCEKRSATIHETGSDKQLEEPYDFLVVGSGLRRVWPVVPQSLYKTDYLKEAGAHIQSIKNADRGVVVIGGGAVGIEMAAELKLVHPNRKVTLIHSRGKLLSSEPLPDDYKDRALQVLKEADVDVILGSRVTETTAVQADDASQLFRLTLSDGTHVETGLVIDAVSRYTPTSSFLPNSALDPEGYVKVHANLMFSGDVPNASSHYAAGDIALWSGIKRCGAAMHQGHHAAINIHQQMLHQVYGTQQVFKELKVTPPMIGIAVGKQAVCYDPDDGTTAGEDLMKAYFSDDLSHQSCFNYMLGTPFSS